MYGKKDYDQIFSGKNPNYAYTRFCLVIIFAAYVYAAPWWERFPALNEQWIRQANIDLGLIYAPYIFLCLKQLHIQKTFDQFTILSNDIRHKRDTQPQVIKNTSVLYSGNNILRPTSVTLITTELRTRKHIHCARWWYIILLLRFDRCSIAIRIRFEFDTIFRQHKGVVLANDDISGLTTTKPFF